MDMRLESVYSQVVTLRQEKIEGKAIVTNWGI